MIILWGGMLYTVHRIHTCYYSAFQCSIQDTVYKRYHILLRSQSSKVSKVYKLRVGTPSKQQCPCRCKIWMRWSDAQTTGRVTVSSTSWNDLHGFFGVTRVGLGSFSGNDVGTTAKDELFTMFLDGGWTVHPGWDRNGRKPKAGLPQSKKMTWIDSGWQWWRSRSGHITHQIQWLRCFSPVQHGLRPEAAAAAADVGVGQAWLHFGMFESSFQSNLMRIC